MVIAVSEQPENVASIMISTLDGIRRFTKVQVEPAAAR